jgi:hypothetical protein
MSSAAIAVAGTLNRYLEPPASAAVRRADVLEAPNMQAVEDTASSDSSALGAPLNAFKVVAATIGVLALGALLVSVAVLKPSLMMLFIGLPLILASLADALENHPH